MKELSIKITIVQKETSVLKEVWYIYIEIVIFPFIKNKQILKRVASEEEKV